MPTLGVPGRLKVEAKPPVPTESAITPSMAPCPMMRSKAMPATTIAVMFDNRCGRPACNRP